MRVRVRVVPGGGERLVELETGTVAELLAKLGLGREGGVVVREGRPLLEEEKLRDGEEVTVYVATSVG